MCIGSVSQPDVTLSACQPIDGECKKAKMQNTIKYKTSMNEYEKETWLFAFWLFVQRYFTSVPACLFL